MNNIELAVYSAKKIRENYPNDYLGDAILVDLCSKNNIDIDYFSFSVNKICGMLLSDELGQSIVINKKHHKERRLFTLGHEVGHFVLHKEISKSFHCTRLLEDTNLSEKSLEAEANNFSAEILMPETQYLDLLEQDKNFSYIATHFGVSLSATKWRYIFLCERHGKINVSKKKFLIEALIENNLDLEYV